MSLPALTPKQLYQTFRRAGFPPHLAVTMGAIALRESSGVPDAYNGNKTTGDRSYGLLQINMLDKNVSTFINDTVLRGQAEGRLLDPDMNAQAGYALWGKRNSNLDIAWYIGRVNKDGTDTDYKKRYESHLPAMQKAALETEPNV